MHPVNTFKRWVSIVELVAYIKRTPVSQADREWLAYDCYFINEDKGFEKALDHLEHHWNWRMRSSY